jgi:hypothetical protein
VAGAGPRQHAAGLRRIVLDFVCWRAIDLESRMPGGHFMHREHPQRFIEELLRVLQRGE